MFQSILQFIFIFSLGISHLFAGEGIIHANDYQKNSNLQIKWALESLEGFLFNECDKVLDIGCGTGFITAEIASKVTKGIVIGLDISEEMLIYARDHYPASNLIYMQGDARKLPFVEQFDKIVALLSFNWINEQEQALSSLFKALKPNGRAIITRPGKQPSNLGPLAQTLVKMNHWAPYFPNFEQKKRYYNVEEYALLLENTGFVIEKIGQTSTSTLFENREALIGFFRPLCNFIDHLTPSLQQQFVEEIVDKVIEFNQQLPDGSILLHDFKLEAIVSKPS
jgi:trans-aconitate 2-methyltransferase